MIIKCKYCIHLFAVFSYYFVVYMISFRGPGSSVGIATDYGLDGPGSNPGGTRFSAPETQPASCKMGTGSFPGGKVRPERAAEHSPPSSAAVMEEYSYTSTHPLGQTGPVTGSLYLYMILFHFARCCMAQLSFFKHMTSSGKEVTSSWPIPVSAHLRNS